MKQREPVRLPSEQMHFEIRSAPDTAVLWPLRTFATSLAAQMGFGDEEIDQIEMAVDEACANVVRHAYKHVGLSIDLPPEEQKKRAEHHCPSLDDCYLMVRICATREMLRFQIEDNGIGIERTPSGVGDIEEYVERGGKGGLGIYIIRNFMDEVEVECPAGRGTVLTMTKYLKPVGAKA